MIIGHNSYIFMPYFVPKEIHTMIKLKEIKEKVTYFSHPLQILNQYYEIKYFVHFNNYAYASIMQP